MHERRVMFGIVNLPMSRCHYFKRVVALVVMIGWMVMLGVHLVDACEDAAKAPEDSDQLVEQALATPVEQSISFRGELSGACAP